VKRQQQAIDLLSIANPSACLGLRRAFFSLSYHDDDGRASKGLTSSSRAIPQVDLEWEREILSSLGEAELRAKIESSSGRFAIHFHSAHIRTNSK
jgi:hypothetical protein